MNYRRRSSISSISMVRARVGVGLALAYGRSRGRSSIGGMVRVGVVCKQPV